MAMLNNQRVYGIFPGHHTPGWKIPLGTFFVKNIEYPNSSPLRDGTGFLDPIYIYIYPSCLSHCAEKQKWWIRVSDDHQSGSTLLIYHCWWDIRIYLMELYYLQVVIQATAKSFPELSSAPPDQRWPHQCELGERPLAIDLWNGRWRALKECLNFKHLPEMDRGKALNMG